MKKIFTLLAGVLLAMGAQAETLIDFTQSKTIGITLGGTCESTTVNIHTNADSKDCIKFANGYTTDSELNGNYVTLTTDGGFKAGDVITIAGVFSNSDNSKQAAVSLFIMDTAEDHGYKVLWTTENFINGRTSADDPKEQTYTLEADADNLYLGRKGNTATYITKLQVKRGTNGIQKVLPTTIENNAAIYNLQGQRVDASYRGVVIQNGKKAIQK